MKDQLILRKSTIKTIEEKYYFDRWELEHEAEDYGYTLSTKYGCYVFVEPDGEIVDYGHPVLITYQGQKYPGVYWSERESGFEIDGKWFDTVLNAEQIDSLRVF